MWVDYFHGIRNPETVDKVVSMRREVLGRSFGWIESTELDLVERALQVWLAIQSIGSAD